MFSRLNRNLVGPWKNSGSSVLSAHAVVFSALSASYSSLNVSKLFIVSAFAGGPTSSAMMNDVNRISVRNIIMLFFMVYDGD